MLTCLEVVHVQTFPVIITLLYFVKTVYYSIYPSLLFYSMTGRPLSHASSSSSGRNSPVFLAPAKSTGPYVPPDDDPIVMQTTVVVRSVMELSNKVPLSRPTDYVEFVKVSVLLTLGAHAQRGLRYLPGVFVCVLRVSSSSCYTACS